MEKGFFTNSQIFFDLTIKIIDIHIYRYLDKTIFMSIKLTEATLDTSAEAFGSATAVEVVPTPARQWIGLSLAVLVLAGLFALAVVLARMPPFDRLVTDPLFFKRCLVGHVNMSLVVWFYSFIAGLLFLLPSGRDANGIRKQSPTIALVGILMMLAGSMIPGTQAVLSNYVPTIDHWLFRSGQIVFGMGVLASLLDKRLFLAPAKSDGRGFKMPTAAQEGLHIAVIALVLAAMTLLISLINRPIGVEVDVFYELVIWGTGHLLQLVSTIAMIAVWIILLTGVIGKSPVSEGGSRILFWAMLLPWLVAPFLAMQGTTTGTYRSGFTHLMQWCIFPITSIFLFLCIRSIVDAWHRGTINAKTVGDPRFTGFAVSAGLTLLGFGLGAAIRGSNTMVPAHYHASIGAITVAFMAVTGPILEAFGFSIHTKGLRRAFSWQPALYGGGMLLFVVGFGFAGAHGMGRKVYGAEQSTRGLAETLGLATMGVGGLVAIAGGLLFLWIVGTAWWRGSTENEQPNAVPSASEST